MKAIFIDCDEQSASVFSAISQPDDPAVTLHREPFAPTDLPRLLDGYAICLDDHSTLPTANLAQCRALKHVVFLGTGAASYMDVEALRRHDIQVYTIKGYGDVAVAEHAIALMLACARDLGRMDHEIRTGTWIPREGVQLRGKILGVIGLGGIGREVARIGGGLGMEVIAWNRTPRPEAGVVQIDLDSLLARADVVSIHLGLTGETRNFLDASRIARMKPGAILVNTARGALLNEDALIEALERGCIRHAGLDVFHGEPLDPNHRLARMPNVTLSAHAAYNTREASMTLMRRAIDIVRDLVAA
jgi:D-3-phosphoglycerate dehydrogenase / 2-oxoglutarate reductase